MSGLDARTVRGGFFGKLPSRGDFVRMGLSRAIATGWDDWVRTVLPVAQETLGAAWDDVWAHASAWRFTLGPGACGVGFVTGLWLPSSDSVGRSFPLMIAAETAAVTEAFLDAAERFGREAIDTAAPPEVLARRLGDAPAPGAGAASPGAARWWRAGQPVFVEMMDNAMPDPGTFLRMLTA